MKPLRKVYSLLLAMMLVLALAVISIVLPETSPALALEKELEAPVSQAPADDSIWAVVVFTDPAIIDIRDLSGNVIGEGRHEGAVSCNRSQCSHKTQLTLDVPSTDPISIEYKFTTRQALDPDAERLVVSGKGTKVIGNQKERFLFTATFENHGDGTVTATYVASRPDASFIIASQPATFRILSRR